MYVANDYLLVNFHHCSMLTPPTHRTLVSKRPFQYNIAKIFNKLANLINNQIHLEHNIFQCILLMFLLIFVTECRGWQFYPNILAMEASLRQDRPLAAPQAVLLPVFPREVSVLLRLDHL